MSTGTGDILACRRAPHLHRFGMSTGTSTSFWYVHWHIYYVTLYYSPFPTYFLASRGVILACRRVILACRRAHLLFYILLFSLSNLLFGMSTGSLWHADGHNYYFTLCYSTVPTYFLASRGVILACRRGHFGMSTGTPTILRFTTLPVQPTSWHRGASFWHVHGVILACPWAHLLFQYYFTLFSLATLLFGIAGTFTILHFTIILSSLLFGIGGRHFGMSTGTSTRFVMPTGTCTILHFTILPVQPTYSWHRGASFWHRRGHFGMSTDTFTSSHFTFSLSNLLFGIAGRLFGILTGTLSFLQFTILPFQTTFWHL